MKFRQLMICIRDNCNVENERRKVHSLLSLEAPVVPQDPLSMTGKEQEVTSLLHTKIY